MLRTVLAVVFVLSLAGCGADSESATAPSESTTTTPDDQGVRLDEAAVVEAGKSLLSQPVGIERTATSRRADSNEPPTAEIGYTGNVDVSGDRGRLEVDLGALNDVLGGESPGGMPSKVDVRWEKSDMWIGAAGQFDKVERGDPSGTSAMLGRLPDEAITNVRLLSKATNITPAGTEEVDGSTLSKFTFDVAEDSGQKQLSAGTVWLDETGKPAKAEFTGEARSLPSLPARAHEMTLRYSDFGEDFTARP